MNRWSWSCLHYLGVRSWKDLPSWLDRWLSFHVVNPPTLKNSRQELLQMSWSSLQIYLKSWWQKVSLTMMWTTTEIRRHRSELPRSRSKLGWTTPGI